MKFRATVELGGKTATGIPVPENVMEALGPSKRPAVQVTIGKHTFRTTVGSMGGQFLIPLSVENRTAAGVAAGETVNVTIALDTAPREVEVPDDFSKALATNAQARKAFAALSYSHQRRWVLSINEAKTPETRQRRIAKAITSLRE